MAEKATVGCHFTVYEEASSSLKIMNIKNNLLESMMNLETTP